MNMKNNYKKNNMKNNYYNKNMIYNNKFLINKNKYMN